MSARPIIRRALVPALLAAALGGCGAAPPQPPLHQTKKLATSTNDISTACGLAYQVTEFPGDHHRELTALEASATHSARSLASVYRRNPDWIFQGDSVRSIVGEAVTMLGACGLTQAQRTLLRATSP